MSERSATTPAPPPCPSEAVLDAYELGELKSPALEHVSTCPLCQEKLRDRAAAFQSLRDREAMVRAIHLAVSGPERPRRKRWGWITGAGLATASAAILVTMRPGPPPEGMRSKGGMGLSVFVERDGTVTRARSGESFRAGERLRFELDLQESTDIMILGREASGRVYAAFPSLGTETGSQRLEPGPDQLLPGAVILDASTGRETLYLVGCNTPFDSEEIEITERGARAPEGCSLTPFVLDKGTE